MKFATCSLFVFASAHLLGQAPVPPKAGPVAILRSSEIKAGMKATAWTVFEGSVAEPVPVEIVGLWKNAWGPKQDVIIGKMGGRAQRTNVAGGMSGSPVYIDGKLIGAVALRMSVFSPDAICGITPIEHMLEITALDASRPADARVPGQKQSAGLAIPDGLLAQVVAAGASPALLRQSPMMVPIETPLSFAGFHPAVLEEFRPYLQQMGITAVQGGASGAVKGSTPAAGWQKALSPGDAVAGVLVSGDMSVTGMGTVTYNDGKRVLAFGHSFFNLGPVNMPMSEGEVLMVLSSQFQPNKFANATSIVGALKQDRHSGIMGELGASAETIPVTVTIRNFSDAASVRSEKKYNYDVFVQQKWTPFLMMMTVFNTLQGINDFAEDTTYRMSGQVEIDGPRNLSLSTMVAPSEVPVPGAMQLAGWWAEKFNRLFGNTVGVPKLRRVNATIDLLPERRSATIDNAWLTNTEVAPGAELRGKVFLRPYRGALTVRDFSFKAPANLAKGEHRLLISDSDVLNRTQNLASVANRHLNLDQTVSLLNQERANNKLYFSLLESRPTVYSDDKALPGLPASVLNVLQASRTPQRPYVTSPDTATQQMELSFDQVISGSTILRFTVR
ncbi:MAG: hypothetical protein IT161_00745 [Bryobacterales bacterium]|nr:hypothetical protein [Bryobacterales bacterium]